MNDDEFEDYLIQKYGPLWVTLSSIQEEDLLPINDLIENRIASAKADKNFSFAEAVQYVYARYGVNISIETASLMKEKE